MSHAGGECLKVEPRVLQVLADRVVLLLRVTQIFEPRFPGFEGLSAADDVVQVVEQGVRIALAE